MTIGDNIKKIRKEKKLTQQQLAKEMGISRSYLSDVENNRYNPSIKTLISLANKLGVTMPYLTTGKKMIADLDIEERSEGYKRNQEHAKKVTELQKERIKENLKEISTSEISFVETQYLNYVTNILKFSTAEQMIIIATILSAINDIINEPINRPNKKETKEYKEFAEGEIKYIVSMLNELYFNDKEGD